MPQKILVVQFRQDLTKEHEQKCIQRQLNPADQIEFWDIFDLARDFSEPAKLLKGFDKLILGGSAGISMGPDHPDNDYVKVDFILDRVAPLTRYILEVDFPTFGTCFGHQLLGHFLGVHVVHDKAQAEAGFAEIVLTDAAAADKIFASLTPRFQAVVGHQDSLEVLPAGATLLAYSAQCRVHAFRYKDNVYGTQFHGELDEQDLMYRLNLFPVYRQYALDLAVQDSSQALKTLQGFLDLQV